MDNIKYEFGDFEVYVEFEAVEVPNSHRYTIELCYMFEPITRSSNVIDKDKSPINSKEQALNWAKRRMNHYTDKLNQL